MPCIFSCDLRGILHTGLESKLPLVRATWAWTQMDALQNRVIQRQVCWFDSFFIQLIVLFQKTSGNGNLLLNILYYLHTYVVYR